MNVRVASFLSVALAVELVAQPGTLTGVISTADGRPVSHARITVLGTDLVTITGVDGRFRLAGVPKRAQTLDVRMIGYAPLRLAFEILAETLHVVPTLTPIPLAPLDVRSDAVTSGVRGFEERRARGAGVFFTREDIQRLRPRELTDILRRVPGIQVRSSGGPRNTGSVQARGSNCALLFYLDGSVFPLPGDSPINNYISPDEILGIEVYSGASEVPAQFNTSRYNARCGVIVLWTRYGADVSRPRN